MINKIYLTSLFWANAIFMAAQTNTILIIADDFGTDYCNVYEEGTDTADMPNIRALWSRGIRFDEAWAFPYCSTTRAAMLTGRYPFRTGVGTVIDGPSSAQLDTAEISIPKILHAALQGSATANIGKWHLHTAAPANRNNPEALGYDHYAGMFIGQVSDYYNWQKIVDGAAPVTVTNYATTEITDDAIDWLQSVDPNQPFFLWLAYNAPHTPYHVPPANLHTVPGLTGTTQHIQQNQPLYYKAMAEAMDTEIGRLVSWLESHQLLEQTNIVFMGDNGDPSSVCQYPNADKAKGTIYQNGVRVPLVIAGPSVTTPNHSTSALVSVLDLFATTLEWSGVNNWQSYIPASKPVDAVSLMPILTNQSNTVREWVFTEVFEPVTTPDDGKAIRDDKYKLLRFDDGHEAFFKVSTDPFEQTDLLLSLPLSSEAKIHYLFLCNALNNLLGTASCTLLGDEDIELATRIVLSPNPVTNLLVIAGPADIGIQKIEAINTIGQLVWTGVYQPAMTIDMSQWPSGVYQIVFSSDARKVYNQQVLKTD